jgi:hypothetical protein
MGWLHAAQRVSVWVLREAGVGVGVVVRWEEVKAEAEAMVRGFGRDGCGILWLYRM